MTVAGRLEIVLNRSDASVRIRSSRPLGFAHMFEGRTPAEVVNLVPLVFNVCGMAQGVASVRACEKALGIEASASTLCARDLLILAETAREHLLRVVMDWRRLIGLEADPLTARRVFDLDLRFRKVLSGPILALGGADRPAGGSLDDLWSAIIGFRDLVDTIVFTEPAKSWLKRSRPIDLAAWFNAGSSPAQLMLQWVEREAATHAGEVPLNRLPIINDARR